jgi:hypothetical protein
MNAAILAALDGTVNIQAPSTIAVCNGKFYSVEGGEFNPHDLPQ